MAYDEYSAERITSILKSRKVDFESKKMMRGLVFMVNHKNVVVFILKKK